MADVTGEQVLAVPVETYYYGTLTVREYLVAMARVLWEQQGSLSGKSAMGDSDWPYEVYAALSKAGLTKAKKDRYGDPSYDFKESDRLIGLALDVLSAVPHG